MSTRLAVTHEYETRLSSPVVRYVLALCVGGGRWAVGAVRTGVRSASGSACAGAAAPRAVATCGVSVGCDRR